MEERKERKQEEEDGKKIDSRLVGGSQPWKKGRIVSKRMVRKLTVCWLEEPTLEEREECEQEEEDGKDVESRMV